MKCPNCNDISLKSYVTPIGVEIDFCPHCKGTWLDQGEILSFSKYPQKLEKLLNDALSNHHNSSKLSPRTDEPMLSFSIKDLPITIEYCPKTHGLWFDDTEFTKFVQFFQNELLPQKETSSSNPEEAEQSAQAKPLFYFQNQPAIQIPALALKLPSLMFHSISSFVGLYALLGLLLVLVFEYFHISQLMALYTTLAFFVLNILLTPWLMDMSLFFFYKASEQPLNKLPEYLQEFITLLCHDHSIKTPKIYLIDDEAPQAFTYGYTPNSARLVFSKGIYTLLEDEETEAVIAHEFGHIVHWDMALMTILQFVPQMSYLIYRSAFKDRSSGSSSGSKKENAYHFAIAIVAFVIYIVTHYIVLWFSRVREYHADRFSAQYTKNPVALANALIKIGYGLALHQTKESRASNALSIYDTTTIPSFAIAAYNFQKEPSSKQNSEEIKEVMKWDFWNPWGKIYELGSTHPLIGKRLIALSDFSQTLGKKPFFELTTKPSESYWDGFIQDFIIYCLPLLAIIPIIFELFNTLFHYKHLGIGALLSLSLFIFGLGSFIKALYTYRGDYFPQKSIASLLKILKVSEVTPVPCVIEGTIIGKGVPGYLLCEDFVVQDATGILLLDYKQPFGLWELFFALFKAENYQNKEVIIKGWYRRSPVPRLEILHIKTKDGSLESTTYYGLIHILVACVFMVLSGVLMFYLF